MAASAEPDLTDVTVAISRTEPRYDDHPEVQEIKQLYLDAIAAARRQLYIENQYFSAASLAHAMKQRLAEPEGPEIVLVSRTSDSGWLEAATVGVIRARLHRLLCGAAPERRYAILYPHIPGRDGRSLNVHSKLLIMDDALVTIGSANLSNRSMGFDTECNLTIEADGDERIERALRALRHRLLAEHLGTDMQHVASTERRTGSLLATISALRNGERSLEPLELEWSEDWDDWVPDGEILDPERPIEPQSSSRVSRRSNLTLPVPRGYSCVQGCWWPSSHSLRLGAGSLGGLEPPGCAIAGMDRGVALHTTLGPRGFRCRCASFRWHPSASSISWLAPPASTSAISCWGRLLAWRPVSSH